MMHAMALLSLLLKELVKGYRVVALLLFGKFYMQRVVCPAS